MRMVMAGTLKGGVFAVVVDDPAIDQDGSHVASSGAGDKDLKGIESGVEIGVGDAVPVEHDDIGALAGFEAADVVVECQGFRAAKRGHVEHFTGGDVPVVQPGNAVQAAG